MPVIIAAVEGLADPSFRLEHMQVTTNAHTPFLLVNGPVRKKLEINFGARLPGARLARKRDHRPRGAPDPLQWRRWPAGGLFQEQLRLADALFVHCAAKTKKRTPGHPFTSTVVTAREQSTVTVFDAVNYCSIGGTESVGTDEILRQIATNMPPMHGSDGGSALLLLGVNNAQTLHEAGLTKRDIQQRLWELARLPDQLLCKAFRRQATCGGPWRCRYGVALR